MSPFVSSFFAKRRMVRATARPINCSGNADVPVGILLLRAAEDVGVPGGKRSARQMSVPQTLGVS